MLSTSFTSSHLPLCAPLHQDIGTSLQLGLSLMTHIARIAVSDMSKHRTMGTNTEAPTQAVLDPDDCRACCILAAEELHGVPLRRSSRYKVSTKRIGPEVPLRNCR